MKALINSKIKQLEKSKVVSKPLLAEETELEDAKALRKAIDDMVAEIHEHEERSEARILPNHSDVETFDRSVKVNNSRSALTTHSTFATDSKKLSS